MTSNNGRKRTTSKKSSSSSSKKSSSKGYKLNTPPKKRRNTAKKQEETLEFDYVKALIVIGIFALFILMFVFSLNVFEGGFALLIKGLIKGLFGFDAYIIPIIGSGLLIYFLFNDLTKKTIFNIASGVLLAISIGMLAHSIAYEKISSSSYKEMLKVFYHEQKGGGALIGSICYLIDKSCGEALIWILAIIFIIASIAVLFGKYIVRLSKYLYEKFTSLPDEPEETEYTKREIRKMREAEEERKKKKLPSYQIDNSEKEETKTEKKEPEIIDVNPGEIKTIFELDKEEEKLNKAKKEENTKESNDIHQIDPSKIKKNVIDDEIRPVNVYGRNDITTPTVNQVIQNEKNVEEQISLTASAQKMLETTSNNIEITSVDPTLDLYKKPEQKKSTKAYKFPPISLLKGSSKKNGNGKDDILETANKLKDTLQTFGVEVSIDPDNCSRGPAVTRYELIPAPGVKVSRIVSLSDDIKLSLGAADIRIEAPIPGKSAVGIEVPNSESTAVPFKDLIETSDFKNSASKLSFAVGKDLSGLAVITDIAKMPHLLIAGATGSGKSVCINTVIMSILYKAHPDDVKLILIDPKVVELSVYNGIPHLLLPVVTDPKKASASLHWGVSEMEDRYKKFADLGVRDIKGYNEKMSETPDGKRLPQIVIIVDELADLMMVAGKEVEESICRIAQLARAAGIHLIIATQRPSVDVITGLIKANMPSRIAFSVSSGVDSRTILDTTGAEKLLGKGDMLFFPQGTNKPSRVQGCFVSDNEVLDVVDFIKNQNIEGYDERIMESVSSGNVSAGSSSSETDELFAQAGVFIIGKEKASIGALQRAFKIGFNRAARIMDQLEAMGVVGPEEGTKPRKILMSNAEFENLVNSLNK